MCRKLKEQRKTQQDANVKRKQALKEELRQKSLAGMAKHAEEAVAKAEENSDSAPEDSEKGIILIIIKKSYTRYTRARNQILNMIKSL